MNVVLNRNIIARSTIALDIVLNKVWDSVLKIILEAITNDRYHQTEQSILEEINVIRKSQQNPNEFAPIYLKYHDQIFLYINKRVDNLDLTAEITSRVFLKCLNNISKFNYQGVPFSAWLYKIAINEINQFFRQEKDYTRTVSINDFQIETLVNEIDYSEPLIDSHVLIPVLLEQLDENEIQLIELRFFENRSFKEMGFLLGLTEVNAKIKTYRVLNKLKKLSEKIKYED